MVRIGGMDYACAPNEATGRRISDMRLDDGTALQADKNYRVAGWASVNPQTGKPVSEVVAGYLRAEKVVKIKRANRVTIKGAADNPGFSEGG